MISLMEYLESKNALRSAYLKNPTKSLTYKVSKYSKLPVFQGDKITHIHVRPNDLIEVVYLASDNKLIHHLRFICEHNLDIADEKFFPKWTPTKIEKWILGNASIITAQQADDLAHEYFNQ